MREHIIYFDACSINHLYEIYGNGFDFEALDFHSENCRLKPVLSQITMFEILLTQDERKRNDLIAICQKMFGIELFPSICEMIDFYIGKQFGNNLEEIDSGFYSSCSLLADVWYDIHDQYCKTAIVDSDVMYKYKRKINKYAKYIYKSIKNEFQDNNESEFDHILTTAINMLYSSLLPLIQERDRLWSDRKTYYKANIFFIVYSLLYLESPFNNIQDFWNTKKLDGHKILSVKDKIWVIENYYNELLFSGPTVYMAEMALSQSSKKYSNGLFFDCLHAGFFSYCDMFASDDNHFKEFEPTISDSIPCSFLCLSEK